MEHETPPAQSEPIAVEWRSRHESADRWLLAAVLIVLTLVVITPLLSPGEIPESEQFFADRDRPTAGRSEAASRGMPLREASSAVASEQTDAEPAEAKAATAPANAADDPLRVDDGMGDAQPAEARLEEERLRREAVGVWMQMNTGTRRLTVRADGTATMHVAFDWLTALAMGKEVTVEIAWSIEDDRILMRSVSGVPEKTFRTIAKTYGRERERLIVELSSTRMIFRNPETGDDSIWTRVPQPK